MLGIAGIVIVLVFYIRDSNYHMEESVIVPTSVAISPTEGEESKNKKSMNDC